MTHKTPIPLLVPWLWTKKKKVRRWGKRPQGPRTGHQKCHGPGAGLEKEFPDMRQSEREIKFIRVGGAARTVGQLKRKPILNRGP